MRLCARGSVKAKEVPPCFPGGVEKKLPAVVVTGYRHREAPGAALQSLING